MNTKIQTYELRDLAGRTIKIKSFTDGSTDIVCAIDTKSGELFVLKEINHPACADEPSHA